MEKWYELTKSWNGKSVGEQIQMSPEDAAVLIKADYAKEVVKDVNAELITATLGQMTSSFAGGLEKAMNASVDAVLAKLNKNPVINVTSDAIDGKKCFTDFLLHSNRAEQKNDPVSIDRLQKVYKATKSALAEASGTTGGDLVPPEYLNRLMELAAEDAIVRPRAEIIPMNTRTIEFPMLDQTTVQATGVTPYFGGIVANWTGESKSRAETEPAFKSIELVAHELAAISNVSRILMMDSIISVDKMLTTNFAKAIGWYEDFAFLQGDGLAKPKGVLNSPATIGVTRVWSTNGNTGNKFQLADVATMYSKLLPGSVKSACWVMSQTVLPYLIQLADSSGRTIYMPNPTYNTDGGTITKSVPMTLLGLPVLFTEKLPAYGTTGDVMLCDFSKYVIGERGSVEIASSDQYLFGTNQIAWRLLHRVDGQPWLDLPITYQDGSTQVSPFVKLV